MLESCAVNAKQNGSGPDSRFIHFLNLFWDVNDVKSKEDSQTSIDVAAEKSHKHWLLADTIGEDGGTH